MQELRIILLKLILFIINDPFTRHSKIRTHVQKSTYIRNPIYLVKSFTWHKSHFIILFYKSPYTYLTQPTFYFSFFFFFSSTVYSQFPSNIFLSSTQERHYCSFTQRQEETHQHLYSSALLLHPKEKKKPAAASSNRKPWRYFIYLFIFFLC